MSEALVELGAHLDDRLGGAILGRAMAFGELTRVVPAADSGAVL